MIDLARIIASAPELPDELLQERTCATCRHWDAAGGWGRVLAEWSEYLEWDRLPDHGKCLLGQRNYETQRDGLVPGESIVFWPYDGEQYGASLVTRKDFGCNQWT